MRDASDSEARTGTGSRRRLRVAAIVLPLLLCLLPGPIRAELACSVDQLTDTVDTDHGAASLTPDGTVLVYGRTDFGPVHRILRADLVTGTTDTLSSGPAVRGAPSVSADGRWLAYLSGADPTGGNPDGNFEIFFHDTVTGEVIQATDSTGQNNFAPQIARDGSAVVFTTRNDLVGQNPDGSPQLFRYERSSGALSQLTTISELFGFDVAWQAGLVVFATGDDLTGRNPDGNWEVFLLRLASGRITQLTDTVTGENSFPSIDEAGNRLTFFTDSEELIGPNDTGLPFLVVHDRRAGSFEQLTFRFFNFYGAEISADGTRVVASLNCEVWVWDLETEESTEAVPPESPFICLNDPSTMSRDGSLFALRSFGEPAGSNPDGNIEIFLVRCPQPPSFADGFESGDLSAWTSGETRPGSLAVTSGAAAEGTAHGLEIAVGSPCGTPTELLIAPPPATVQGDFQACSRITAAGVRFVAPDSTLRAGDRVTLESPVVVDAAADWVVALDRMLSPFPYVEHETAGGGRAYYSARFSLRLDLLALGPDDRLDHLVGLGSDGEAFRLSLEPSPGPAPHRLVLAARHAGGLAETPPGEEIELPAGWNDLEVSWRAGAGTGHLLVSVNGAAFAGLTGLFNRGTHLSTVRWGAVDGLVDESSGSLEVDEYLARQ